MSRPTQVAQRNRQGRKRNTAGMGLHTQISTYLLDGTTLRKPWSQDRECCRRCQDAARISGDCRVYVGVLVLQRGFLQRRVIPRPGKPPRGWFGGARDQGQLLVDSLGIARQRRLQQPIHLGHRHDQSVLGIRIYSRTRKSGPADTRSCGGANRSRCASHSPPDPVPACSVVGLGARPPKKVQACAEHKGR